MAESTDTADRTEATPKKLPTEHRDPAEPIEPMDRTDPTELIERIEPFELIESSDPVDRTDHREVPPASDMDPSLRTWCLNAHRHRTDAQLPLAARSRKWTRVGAG